MLATLRKVISFVNERRRQPREETHFPARFVVLSPDGRTELAEPRLGRVLNLSADGCCLAVASLNLDRFHLTRCLESPEDYPLELVIQGPEGQRWRVRGCVRWTNREVQAADLPFRVGLEWITKGLPASCRSLLRQVKP